MMSPAIATDFRARYGPWALVAGASAGLGAAFATQLAARGLNLVLIARRAEIAESLGARLTADYAAQVRVLPLDLARDDIVPVVAAATSDLEIGLLVYNAAASIIGPFFERSLPEHLSEIDTNCRAPMALTYILGQRMLARKRGGIILMSSMSAFQGSALIANYAATKAYNLLLAEGIWEELRTRGVDVLACCAGATSTPNYLASAPAATTRVRTAAMAPDTVAAETLAALGRQPSVIPGRFNRLAAFVMRRLLPRRAAIRLMGRTMRGMYSQ
jgi:short-subunit dehydrogenase